MNEPVKPILQFKISLIDSNPLIWRRIQIVDSVSFYDLHVAIPGLWHFQTI